MPFWLRPALEDKVRRYVWNSRHRRGQRCAVCVSVCQLVPAHMPASRACSASSKRRKGYAYTAAHENSQEIIRRCMRFRFCGHGQADGNGDEEVCGNDGPVDEGESPRGAVVCRCPRHEERHHCWHHASNRGNPILQPEASGHWPLPHRYRPSQTRHRE